MDLDEPSLPSNPNINDGIGNETPPSSAVNDGEDVKPAGRLQRWTRQEILVLVHGKNDAESRLKPGRNGSLFGSFEKKWTLVSSYCEKHGVNRTPIQCKKRWGNLTADYKKIKEWESQVSDETESFWLMNVELRRERKLPGCFDIEVYNILDSAVAANAVPVAVAAPVSEVVGDEEVYIYDSNRKVSGEDELFSDLEKDDNVLSPVPISVSVSEKQFIPLLSGLQGEGNAINEKQPGERKRKRGVATEGNIEEEEEESVQSELIKVLEKNGKMLCEQLEARNKSLQLDRQQQNQTATKMVAVLDKLANALGRIADKL
ncbi:putative transcription factor MYB family [Medicago truncatula]|uniref:Myb/SANT-like DNA-binding domain protein n=1 Tax=Medicago truncatula TaxID=3880 RepID=A0A072VSJ7_MEDTR|nr:trihelix transcription factor ASR3 [Medicago truncatula]KEH44363.1 myb/SANT-like DNA-binding domain protein [Medicago truncatula]RHN82552.1 putative transcription factor MYB family [Medicago truncatula]